MISFWRREQNNQATHREQQRWPWTHLHMHASGWIFLSSQPEVHGWLHVSSWWRSPQNCFPSTGQHCYCVPFDGIRRERETSGLKGTLEATAWTRKPADECESLNSWSTWRRRRRLLTHSTCLAGRASMRRETTYELDLRGCHQPENLIHRHFLPERVVIDFHWIQGNSSSGND